MFGAAVGTALCTGDRILRTERILAVITPDDIVLADGSVVLRAGNEVLLADVVATDGTLLEMRTAVDVPVDTTRSAVVDADERITARTALAVRFADSHPTVLALIDGLGSVMVGTRHALLEVIETTRLVRVTRDRSMVGTVPAVADDTRFDVIGADGVLSVVTGRCVGAADEFVAVATLVDEVVAVDGTTLGTLVGIVWTEGFVVIRTGGDMLGTETLSTLVTVGHVFGTEFVTAFAAGRRVIQTDNRLAVGTGDVVVLADRLPAGRTGN